MSSTPTTGNQPTPLAAVSPPDPDLGKIPTAPTKVALVPFDPDLKLGPYDPAKVAIALENQINQQVHPAWGVSAVVEYVASLAQVAPDQVPLVIVDRSLPDHGVHFSMGGRQCAIVTYDPEMWTAYASHELIELLCDPSGVLTTPGPGLPGTAHEKVNYLVEVCDPVEDSTYLISVEGTEILVSDFVLPSYYAEELGEPRAKRGNISKPFGLLTGGYISWQTLETGEVFQAFAGEPGYDQTYTRTVGPNTPEPFIGKLTIKRLRQKQRPLQKPSARPSEQWLSSGDESLPGKYAVPAQRQHEGDLTLEDKLLIFIDAWEAELPTLEAIIAQLDARGDVALDQVIEALKYEQRISRIFGDDVFGTGIASWDVHLSA